MYVDLKTYQPTYLWLCKAYIDIKINKYLFIYSKILLICHVAYILLCYMSQSRTIINNHNERWRSIFRKEKSFLCPKIFIMSHVKF